ncbi:MAG: TetR/AcrR family transcriptional regulator [Bacteroidota bacterium]
MLKAKDQREKDLRKQHILDSAEAVLRRKGLNGLSISSVAKEAHLAQGTLYLYFKKKEDIIAQLTVRSRVRLLQIFHDSINASSDPLEQIRNIMYANLKFFKGERIYYELTSFYEATLQQEEPPALKQASRNITALVVSVLDRAKNQGVIRSDINASEFTYMIWGTCTGMVQLIDLKSQEIEDNLQKASDKVYDTYVDFVIQGMRV